MLSSLKISNRLYSLLNEPSKQAQTRLVSKVLASTFKFDDLQITTKKIDYNESPFKSELRFGNTFTDHMLEIRWSEKNGWEKPKISPFHNFSMHPASKVFHYAQTLFEGIKAYRCEDGKVRLFRPDMNMNRMLLTAQRAGLAEFDKDELLKCIKKLVKIDERWVSDKKDHSLYIRPCFMGTEPALGVYASNQNILFVILSPVKGYFKNNLEPISLYADENAVRAWPGGCGDKKMGSNYAPTIKVQQNAIKEGCQQVLWLFGKEQQLTEVGVMNIFVFLRNEKNERELVTPPLEDGLILPGVTRDSILELTRGWNEFKVSERIITMKEIQNSLKDGKIIEMFGSGTAAIVSPVKRIKCKNETLDIPNESKDKISPKLLTELQKIQYGKVPHKWMFSIDEI